MATPLQDSFSVLDFMTPEQVVDIRSRAGAIDVSSEVQTALTYAINNGYGLYFPSGVYLIQLSGNCGEHCPAEQ